MKKNEIYTLRCEDDTRMGSGIVKIDNQVVFVPNLMVGELAKIKIIKVQKKYAFGKIMELIEANEWRIEPKCPYTICGGCQYQHMAYPAQLDMKTRHMMDLFKRNVDESIDVLPTLGCDDPYYYRNKAQFPVQVKDDKVIMGFYRQHSNDIVPCDRCRIQSEAINDIYQWIQKHMTSKQADGLRHVFIRHSYFTNESQVVFIGQSEKKLGNLVDALIKAFKDIQSVVFNYNTRNDNVILGDTYKVLYGRDFIYEKCLGNTIQLHFKSFFQVNPRQMEKLYQCAIDMAKLDGKQTCIDMYSGTGTIGLSISKHAKSVLGVEIVKEAVDNANVNKELNHIQNCEFRCQDATEFAHDMKNQKIDVVFVDPPRKGMTRQGIEDVVTMNPDVLIYISCNPDTLARDLNVFKENGYVCEKVQPVDMFAQTTGLECVAKIIRK